MKKSFLLLLLSIFAISVYAKDIQELIVTTTPPMSCQNCENRIKGNLRFEKGVKNIETNITEQRVTITYDADKTNPEKIEKAFSKIGYNVEEINTGVEKNNQENETCQQKSSCCGEGCCQNSK